MTLSSPTITHLADDTTPQTLAAFWAEREREGTPLVEPTDDPNVSLVTWLYREIGNPVAAVTVMDLFSWRPRESCQLSKLDGTDIWHLTWRVRNDLRGSYGFQISFADGSEPRRIVDPMARVYEGDGWHTDEGRTSVLEMPNARPLVWRYADTSVPRGTRHDLTWRSGILNNEREIWVHTPHSYVNDAEPYPFIVIFDGDEPGYPGPEVIDNLIAAGKIPPMIAVMVSQLGIRDQELPGNPDFSRALATELVPWLREEFNLSSDPKHAILNGGSYGGFCSAYTALHHPDVFGNVIMHSPSAWMNPELMEQWARSGGNMSPDPVGEPALIPYLIQEFRDRQPVPIRIWHECGAVENGPPPARIWQTFGNRWLHDILELKGYDTTYREYIGGHDHAWWRGTLAEGLIWIWS